MMGPTLSGLATTANNIGKAEESEKSHQLALTNVRNNYGTGHYRNAFALRNYAHFLIDAELYRQAEDTLNKAHDIIINKYGRIHSLNTNMTNIKATIYDHWNKDEKADLNYRSTINIFEDNYGPDYSRLGKAISSYAIFKFNRQQYQDALKLLERSHDIFVSNNNQSSFYYGKTEYYLGKTMLKLKQEESACKHLNKALKVVTKIKGASSDLATKINDSISESFNHSK